MGRLSTPLLKGLGAVFLAFLVLAVIATIVGIVLSVVATVISALVTLAVLGIFLLAVAGLVSWLRGDDESAGTVSGDYAGGYTARDDATAADPQDRLQSRYVAGEISEDEFERELDRLLESDDLARSDRLDPDRSAPESTSDRTRLRDR
ncbi:SHOCT domain-containing protein [Natronorubrum sp. JWXQ-INN-674]|uniref:SHOCT domain-containing protein n=1 Tax=Natronorubrum halalkaliphilum TaxID=2691917 RepID=A0A6B0VI13_9EURY|nr:SHOCT domain-containing protein [Natronorubrum halalkaliphilum]MXV60737.1 SHOCT domain-containing protein [Natronorubrum halalkaliphilum]